MASVNYTMPVTKAAYVDQSSPSTNYSGSDTVHVGFIGLEYPSFYYTKAFMFSSGWPSSVGKILSNFKLHLTYHDLITGATYPGIAIAPLVASWVENAVTYNAQPAAAGIVIYSGPPTVVDLTARGKDFYDRARLYGIKIDEGSTGQISHTDFPIYSYLAGTEANRPYFEFTLSDSVPVVTPISPLRRFVDPSAPVVFSWEYSNAVGGIQKSYAIQTSPDGAAWTDLASAETSETVVVVAANTINANVKYWRIKVTSEYDIESEWSANVQIVIVSSPICSINTATNTPRPEVQWTCEDQVAFQVACGDYDSGSVYGTQKTFKIPRFMPDGTTTIMVRVQGAFGLWSAWAQTDIDIENAPGSSLELTANATHKAMLGWNKSGGVYYVLRDGVPIVRTEENEYSDELAIGRHEYQIVEQLDGDNYTISLTKVLVLRAENAMLTSVADVNWVQLKYSREQHPTVGESKTSNTTLIHYEGRSLPEAESSGFIDHSLQFDVAFRTQQESAVFEALLGKIVCYKNKIGRIIIGVLSGFSVETDRFYSAYNCTINATDYQEEVVYE